MKSDLYVMGVDFGTDSVRTVIVDAANGKVMGSSVRYYPRWAKGLYCDPASNRFRQHPLDYLESMQASMKEALASSGKGAAAKVRGIAVDTTGSTPVFADAKGKPLALTPEFAEDPDAMFILWKDHTSVAQAEKINALARMWKKADGKPGTNYTKFEGGIYSSEWFWAKALRVVETNPKVAKAAITIIEHCDWIPMVLTGTEDVAKIKRSRCAAGHKAMWHAKFGGYPEDEFLKKLNPALPRFKKTFGKETWTSDVPFGTVSQEWAKKLGIPSDAVVAVGAFDAHMGAVGGDIGPFKLLKVMGTSTCDMLVVEKSKAREKLVKGICGQVDGSIIPGSIGYEAGQSAFGDVYAWFKKLLSWPLEAIVPKMPGAELATKKAMIEEVMDKMILQLEKEATKIPPEDGSVLALDWMNGRRTPDADQRLKGAIVGINLGTDAPRIYRALVEATAFGSRAIVERFRSEGIRIDSAIAIGGVAKKSPFVMQVVADVMNMEIAVSAGDQSVAIGASMFAATAAGLYSRVEKAQKAMSSGTEKVYKPDRARAKLYDAIYAKYRKFGSFVEKELTK